MVPRNSRLLQTFASCRKGKPNAFSTHVGAPPLNGVFMLAQPKHDLDEVS